MQVQNLKFKVVYKIINFGLLVVTLHFALCTLHLSKAYAETLSLRSYPSLIRLNAQTPTDLSSSLTVENLTDSSVTVDTQFKLFKAGPKENGDVEYLPASENPNGILQKIHLQDNENEITGLSLGPNQKKQLQVKINLKETIEPRDYYFSIIFLTKPKDYQTQGNLPSGSTSSFSVINAGVGTNFLISVGKTSENLASIEEFSSSQYLQSGPVAFNIKIQNNGSNYISPTGVIYIKNMFGQMIGKVELPAQNILANSSRYISDQTLHPTPYTLHPQIVWPEKFLLGFYEARLSLQTSESEQPITRTIHFFVFPVKLIIAFTVCLILFTLIYRRVKQKML